MELPRKVKYGLCYLRRSRQDESREKKHGVDTLHEQRLLMTNELKKYDFHYEIRQEIGSGDTIANRPVFSKIVSEIRQGKIDALIVKDFSRLGRGNMKDSGELYELIMKHSILIITPNKIYNPHNDSDLQQMRFEMFLYREEFEMIKKRLNNARKNYAREGKWMTGGGGIPFGYEYDEVSQKLTPNPEESKVVQRIYDWYVSEEEIGLQTICTRLKRKNIPSPSGKKDWHQVVVKRILSNKVYIGTVEFGKTKRVDNKAVKKPEDQHIVVEDAHAAIIDKELFQKAQVKLAHMKNTHPVRTDFAPGILAGLITCPHCGRKMLKNTSSQKYKKKDGTISHFRKEFIACIPCGVYAKYDHVVEAILEFLKTLVNLDEDSIKKQYAKLIEQKMKREESNEEEDSHLLSRKKDIEDSLKLIIDMKLKVAMKGHIPDLYEEKEAELNEELKKVEQEIVKCKQENRAEEDVTIGTVIKERIQNVLDVFQLLRSNEEKNNLLREVIEYAEIEIIEKGRGRRPAKFKLTVKPLLSF
ncbi:DNA invertase Pin-like site-specific DNA recombinase/flagellar biosynthesis/type III secretory pathway chaperone [Salirhabdus euzebyi]|uniref:DNA invertase Pin-like site-specific DNA recombinase/flagellar biosynthesis/type III secretory pathway chaperone n=1 Tax=Salirhabdus euzebyi TaxID=394506 RepID=A0A841PSI7_9BACI|nr:recombinase family protein [Salirhabdus euzebyi]MBB6451769.1 DNA invertase Pin-like site-specific DNA recombinase/flagellar biosynthesis/type III secretory pathway chaperone [Salirhabdus euzebyi]